MRKVQLYGFAIGLPLSVAHAYLSLDDHHLPEAYALMDTAAYAFSVVPLSMAYTCTICLWFLKGNHPNLLKLFSAPGRMALTNYIIQTLLGILIF